MRKADYALLAKLINDEITDNAMLLKVPLTAGDEIRIKARTQAIERLAYLFATNASVNKTEFLKACGVT